MAIEIGEVFTLVDEDGSEEEVEVLGEVELEAGKYIAVAYLNELEDEKKSEEDLDIFFLSVDENDELTTIQSDEEFEQVSAAFEAALAENGEIENPKS